MDGIRGIAILMVLMFHLSYYPKEPLFGVLLSRIAASGWIGVDLFFVLSGFLITGILVDAKGSPRYFRNFYVRRALRIAPLYYALLVFLLLVLPFVHPAIRTVPTWNNLRANQWWLWGYLVNAAMILRKPEMAPIVDAVGHFWSLAVEEQFYLIWPLVVWTCSQATLRRACISYVLVALLLRAAMILQHADPQLIYLNTLTRVDTILVGAWLALAVRVPGTLSGLRHYAPYVLITAGVVLTYIAWRSHGPLSPVSRVVQTIGYTIVAIGSAAVIVLATNRTNARTLLQRALSYPILRFFGRYSYGIYVLHVPVLFISLRLELKAPELVPVFGSVQLTSLWYLATLSTVSVALAMLSWQLIEQPFLRLKRFFPL